MTIVNIIKEDLKPIKEMICLKAEYVNPFLISTKNILSQMAGIDIDLKGTSLKKSPIFPKKVIIVVGIIGQLKGSVIIGLDDSFARTIASNMMGYHISTLDEMSKSALKELSNILMGRVAIDLESKGTKIDITPPTLLTGDNISISLESIPLLSIKFASQKDVNMELDFDISLKET